MSSAGHVVSGYDYDMAEQATAEDAKPARESCCSAYHAAIELIGKRWTGAILSVLTTSGPLRFTQIAHAVPELSDRLLAERMRELEARGLVTRTAFDDGSARVEYRLTEMGADLALALEEVGAWARRWLA
jgi:DNA-binding HxlR family transcriptional regulator